MADMRYYYTMCMDVVTSFASPVEDDSEKAITHPRIILILFDAVSGDLRTRSSG